MHKFRRIAEKVLQSGCCITEEAELDAEVVELLESGRAELIQNRHKWRFLSKLYAILTAQCLLTTIVSSITYFLLSHPQSPRRKMDQCFPFNRYRVPLLNLLSFSIGVGVSFANINGKAGIYVVELLVLTSVTFLCSLGYTFWAPIKDKEINLKTPWFISSFCIFILAGIAQIFFLQYATAGVLCVIFFNIMINYAVECLVENLDYDDYVWASVKIPFCIFMLSCFCG
ncbi:BI1-like protein [Quillaja saponaria]|uniref:BI1-like protein n=1 Tax=Quillaja saponaria TaxID=32244 RepID=A0AAD7LBD1_QUISA|nr:BI1-like protein [Quillaja saponaria]